MKSRILITIMLAACVGCTTVPKQEHPVNNIARDIRIGTLQDRITALETELEVMVPIVYKQLETIDSIRTAGLLHGEILLDVMKTIKLLEQWLNSQDKTPDEFLEQGEEE